MGLYLIEQRSGHRLIDPGRLPTTVNVYVAGAGVPTGLEDLAAALYRNHNELANAKLLISGQIYYTCTFDRYAMSHADALRHSGGGSISDWSRTLIISRVVVLGKPVTPDWHSFGVRCHVLTHSSNDEILRQEKAGREVALRF
jgi:hypothetical protein